MRPPSVDALARSIGDLGLPHSLAVEAAREAARQGDPDSARERATVIARSMLRPVINATGVLLHTNLGRAPIEVRRDARPSNIEFDLETGRRGGRAAGLRSMLARLVGAPAALVVNNGAAALYLALAALGAERVIISRGELVEIGGGFRVPDVITSTGAQLVEVGTTNRTRANDYERALSGSVERTVVLKVHRSNYRMVGFTDEPELDTLSGLGAPLVADIGSGLVDASTPWLRGGPPPWLASEPAARQTLEAGAALVTFSCDKLFGGPQAGVIAGTAPLVERCATHPLMRVLRPGGLVLGALEEVTLAYLRRDGRAIPFWAMATEPVERLVARAQALRARCPDARVIECSSVAGGGSLPGIEVPSAGLAIPGDRLAELRRHRVPVIARAQGDETLLDLRSVAPSDDEIVGEALCELGT